MSAPPKNQRLKLEWVPVGQVVHSGFNTNKMSTAEFERLKKELAETGVIDAPSVVEMEDGTYRIMGGHHRYDAMVQLGYDEVPVQVIPSAKKWHDLDYQKFVHVRLNIIHGSIDPDEFAKLHAEMALKYGADALQEMFGFTDAKAFAKILGGVKKNLKKALPPDMHKQVDQALKEAKTVEDLTTIINMLFAQYGETVGQSFMVFTYGKQNHIYIQMDKPMRKGMDKVMEYCRATGEDINAVLAPVVQEWAKSAGEKLANSSKKPEKPGDDGPEKIDVIDDDPEDPAF